MKCCLRPSILNFKKVLILPQFLWKVNLQRELRLRVHICKFIGFGLIGVPNYIHCSFAVTSFSTELLAANHQHFSEITQTSAILGNCFLQKWWVAEICGKQQRLKKKRLNKMTWLRNLLIGTISSYIYNYMQSNRSCIATNLNGDNVGYVMPQILHLWYL